MTAWSVLTLAGFVGEGMLHNVVFFDGLLLGRPEIQGNRCVLDLVTSVGDQDIWSKCTKTIFCVGDSSVAD